MKNSEGERGLELVLQGSETQNVLGRCFNAMTRSKRSSEINMLNLSFIAF